MNPATSAPTAVILRGLWHENPALVQLLGLCPLLAVSGTAVNAAALGLVTLMVLVATSALVSWLRAWLSPEIRIAVFVALIAGLVTIAELVMHATLPALHARLGLFLPLVVTNCLVIARAEAFASRRPTGIAMLDALAQGAGFALVLFVLGALRELVGHGSLFAGAGYLLGWPGLEWRSNLYEGFLPVVLAPGAFFGLAFLIAGHRWFDGLLKQRSRQAHGAVARPVWPALDA